MSPKTDLSPRRAAFVAALVAGMTQAEAAESIGVRPRTCRRWFADPVVRAAVRQAQDDALGEVTRRMNAGSQDALRVLREVMQDGDMPPSVRVRAAQVWLDTAFRARELLELADRVAGLEQQLEALENEQPTAATGRYRGAA